jgi:hypothetical protein
MWNPLNRSSRPTWNPTRRKYSRLGVTGVFAVAVLIVIFVAGWLLDRRGASEADQRLAELARSADESPEDHIARAAQSSRIVFLTDIHNSAAVKQFAARAIERISAGSGLDAVVLEVGEDQQASIDQYFDMPQEDASVLMSNPKTIREPGAATRAYLEIYHTIWKINEKLGPDERIRVIAADLPGWPPDRSPSPGESATAMGKRPQHMEQVIQNRILQTIPSARILVFMTGFHALKTGSLALQTGGSTPVNVQPLAKLLAASTDEAYTIVVDAPSVGAASREIVPFLGTRVAEVLQGQGVRKRFGASVTSDFDYLRNPITEKKSPGIDFSVLPRDYKLRDVADGYINLGN